MSHRRLVSLFILGLPFCAISRAQDSSIVRLDRIIEDLHAKRILSDLGAARLQRWTVQLSMNDDSPEKDEERFQLQFMEMAGRNCEARERLSCFHFWSDSLHRAGLLPTKGRSAHERNIQLAQEVVWDCGGMDGRRAIDTVHDLSWALVYDRFRYEHDALVQDTAFLHPGFAQRSGRPTEILEQLHTSGVVDGLLYPILQQELACGKLQGAASLFQCASHEIHDRQHRRLQAELVHRLMSAGKCTEVDGHAILARIEAYGSLDRSGLAAASARTVIVPVAAQNACVDTLYFLALERIGSLSPGLQLTPSGVYRTKVEVEGVLADSLVHVEFAIAGEPYGFDTYEARAAGSQEPDYGALIEAVNKGLCDTGSPYRIFPFLHWRKECDAYYPDSMRMALFDRAECALWWPEAPFSSALHEHMSTGGPDHCAKYFSTTFCKERIQEMVDRFQHAGVLSHLTPQQIEASTKKANMTLHSEWAHILSFFPDVSYDIQELYKPVVHTRLPQLLRGMSDISHGSFNATDIKICMRDHSYDVSFRYAGKRYRKKRLVALSGSSMPVIQFVNSILADNGELGRFCPLDNDPGRSILFLYRDQFRALVDPYLSLYLGDPWEERPHGKR